MNTIKANLIIYFECVFLVTIIVVSVVAATLIYEPKSTGHNIKDAKDVNVTCAIVGTISPKNTSHWYACPICLGKIMDMDTICLEDGNLLKKVKLKDIV